MLTHRQRGEWATKLKQHAEDLAGMKMMQRLEMSSWGGPKLCAPACMPGVWRKPSKDWNGLCRLLAAFEDLQKELTKRGGHVRAGFSAELKTYPYISWSQEKRGGLSSTGKAWFPKNAWQGQVHPNLGWKRDIRKRPGKPQTALGYGVLQSWGAL